MATPTLSSYAELEAALAHDTKIQLAAIDIDGVLRGKVMIKSKFLSSVKSGGFGFCSVVFGWDITDRTYTTELGISNFANGYRDLTARIDLNTYRRTPSMDPSIPSIPFFLITFIDPETNETLCACPRGLLQRVTKELKDEGLSAFAGIEYEYFNFKETPETIYAKNFQNLQPLTQGMHGYSLLRPQLNAQYFHDLYENSAAFGIDIEGHHTETGPGVYESALVYTGAERMADNAALFKYVAKITGLKHGVLPTFMAKPYADQPGCGGHEHFSLQNEKGENVFAVREDEMKEGREGAAYEDTKRISLVAEQFLAGVLLGLPSIMACLVPTINGYKRLVESFWAPVFVSYAYENRVASVRIISPPLASRESTRLEIRVPGADMNPHLTTAAILACGLYGIKHQLPLSQSPLNTSRATSSPTDKLAASLVRLPKTLQEATKNMKAEGSMARIVLGDEFVNHFVGTREHEWDQFSQAVTDWELKRYLELA